MASISQTLHDTALLLTSFKEQGYPKEGIPGIPFDINRIVFQYLPDVCALGSCNRSLYVLHCADGIWKTFLKALHAPESIVPTKESYLKYYHEAWLPATLKTVDRNLQRNVMTRAGANMDMRITYTPKYITHTIDISCVEPKQLHGKGEILYFRDDENVSILDTSGQIIKQISVADAQAIHIENGTLCTVIPGGLIQVICLDSGQVLSEFQGPGLQVSRGEKEFDMRLHLPYLCIGFENGKVLLWNYMTKTQLLDLTAERLCVKSLTSDFLCVARGKEIEKWNLSDLYRNNLKNRDLDSERAPIAQGQGASENPNPDSSGCFGITSQKLICEKEIYSLAIHHGLLIAGHDRKATLFDASNARNEISYDSIEKMWIARTIPFGNMILCQMDTDFGCKGIRMTYVHKYPTHKTLLNLITSKYVAGRNAYYFSSIHALGKNKLLIGTIEKKIHILDFGFPLSQMEGLKKLLEKGVIDDFREEVESVYGQLPQEYKDLINNRCLTINKVSFEALLKDLTEENKKTLILFLDNLNHAFGSFI